MNRSSGLFLFFESLWTFLLTGHVSLRASFFEGIALFILLGGCYSMMATNGFVRQVAHLLSIKEMQKNKMVHIVFEH